jgi:hypothetical protein
MPPDPHKSTTAATAANTKKQFGGYRIVETWEAILAFRKTTIQTHTARLASAKICVNRHCSLRDIVNVV